MAKEGVPSLPLGSYLILTFYLILSIFDFINYIYSLVSSESQLQPLRSLYFLHRHYHINLSSLPYHFLPTTNKTHQTTFSHIFSFTRSSYDPSSSNTPQNEMMVGNEKFHLDSDMMKATRIGHFLASAKYTMSFKRIQEETSDKKRSRSLTFELITGSLRTKLGKVSWRTIMEGD